MRVELDGPAIAVRGSGAIVRIVMALVKHPIPAAHVAPGRAGVRPQFEDACAGCDKKLTRLAIEWIG